MFDEMKRDIKFRFWNGEKMVITDFHITCFGIVWQDDDRADGIQCELMQYTGLKDKNGVEIYDGDIIEVSLREKPGYQYIGSVYWNETTSSYKIKLTKDFYNNDDLYCNASRSAVLGDIHQNPELLTPHTR